MGTITQRKRKNGSVGYTAQIRIKREGKLVHQETQTFDRKQAASNWIQRKESELREPGALTLANAPKATLCEAIERYTSESRKAIGRTKAQVLRSIQDYPIADMDCAEITSAEIVAFANELSKGRKPQTVSNYLSHLGAVFTVARPAWGYQLDQGAMRDAHAVLRRLGVSGKSHSRDRRPTLDELDKLLSHFTERQKRRPSSNPMQRITAFAIFSTRRLAEITRIKWEDLDEEGNRILVRDMKNPGEKAGNNVWCDLPEEALRIIQAMPRVEAEIFPFGTGAIGAAFTRACKFLEIDDLRFHDLRHDGVSRLFEMGMTIPQVATVSGHRSWQSLQRYAHLRQVGDKYKGWSWLPELAKTHPEGT